MTRPMWTLETAIITANRLDELLSRYGWHVALAGGVLRKGESHKDLDLIVFPHSTARQDRSAVRRVLEGHGWKLSKTPDQMRAGWAAQGSDDQKTVEVWQDPKGRRVDMIYWGTP